MERIELLDHGYVATVESWGSDERIIEAARMSTNKGFLGWGPNDCACVGTDLSDGMIAKDWDPACRKCKGTGSVQGDERLLAYLWRNKHATPFEMAGLIIEVQAPIFVFREWHRHRTQSYNELSSRYTPLPNLNYLPTVERMLVGGDGKNKQAGAVKGAGRLTRADAESIRIGLADVYARADDYYQTLLAAGLPKELARCHLPVGRYSRMRASANLRNWLAFLTLRMAPAAQWEIRQYANAVGSLIAKEFPRTWELFEVPA